MTVKLKAYADMIVLIAEVYPDIEVIYSRDDEGNGYESVHFNPTVGTLVDGDFVEPCEGVEEVTACCIN